MTRTLSVRARVQGRPEPPFDHLFDPLVDDLVRGGPIGRERFATRWSDGAALQSLASAKRRPLEVALARELREYHLRLGATQASLENLDRLSRGEAVCAVAGQQPAPLGGPMFALHKTVATVGLSGAIASRTGTPCVPLYWMHGEDSDFVEIRSASLADRSLALHDLTLPASAHREGGLVGSIAAECLAPLEREALGHWEGLPGCPDAMRLLSRARGAARDLGEAVSALMLALFADQGLVIVDPRLPAFRAAARTVIDRYLNRADDLSSAARRAGEWLETRVGRRPLADSALESFVYAIDDGVRRKLTVAEARGLPAGSPLSPSVALRPAVQDGVFPTVAMACGPGEIAYLAQLREVFEGVGVRPACAVPRFGATWLPPKAVELLEASGAEAWELVIGADAVLKRLAERRLPADVLSELERARVAASEGLRRFAAAAPRVDASLPQMVESARVKVDYQFARLLEGLTGKSRHRLEREHPEWLRLRYYLLPGDKLQERRIASLELVAWRGAAIAAELSELALEHARRLEQGLHEHWVVEL